MSESKHYVIACESRNCVKFATMAGVTFKSMRKSSKFVPIMHQGHQGPRCCHKIIKVLKNFPQVKEIEGFYPTALNGCWGIVFTHGVRMGGWAAGNSLSGLYLRNRKV